MIILGLRRDPWANTGAAVIADGGAGPQITMLSEERLDRVKYSSSLRKNLGIGPLVLA